MTQAASEEKTNDPARLQTSRNKVVFVMTACRAKLMSCYLPPGHFLRNRQERSRSVQIKLNICMCWFCFAAWAKLNSEVELCSLRLRKYGIQDAFS